MNERNRYKQHVKEPQVMKRRDFLKYASRFAILLPGTAKANIREQKEEPKNELAEWAKSLIREYNTELDKLQPLRGKKEIDANGIFIAIYNNSRNKAPIPQKLKTLFETDLYGNDLKTFNEKLQPLVHALDSQGYFFLAAPTIGKWKEANLSYIALSTGKIITREEKKTTKRGEESEYDYILIDKFPNEPDQHSSAPFKIHALTFPTEKGMTVMQDLSAYRTSAKNTHDLLKGKFLPTTEGGFLRNRVFDQFRDIPEEVAIPEITNLYLETSLHREERHVLDMKGSKKIHGRKLDQEMMDRRIVGSIRGNISPLTESHPKVALVNISEIYENSDDFGKYIGKEAVNILTSISGKESLLHIAYLPDQKLKDIGERAMGATDILFDAIFHKGMSLKDLKLGKSFNQYVDKYRL